MQTTSSNKIRLRQKLKTNFSGSIPHFHHQNTTLQVTKKKNSYHFVYEEKSIKTNTKISLNDCNRIFSIVSPE